MSSAGPFAGARSGMLGVVVGVLMLACDDPGAPGAAQRSTGDVPAERLRLLPSAPPSTGADEPIVLQRPAPPGMAWIPAGSFSMGTDDPRSMPDERPARRVDVDGFFLDTTLVSNRDFAEFAAETGYVTTAEQTPDVSTLMAQLPPGTPPPNPDLLRPGSLVFEPPPHHVPFHDMSAWWTWVPGASWGHPEGPGSDLRGRADHPVVQVSWNDAVAFCRWAGKRLPSEAEWEYAARGGLEGRRYVWGDEPNPEGRHLANVFQGTFPQLNTIEDGFPRTSPVDAFPANGYGLHDMAGNTWQWCSDRYRSGPRRETGPSCHDTSDSLADPQLERVIKGGSFLCHASYCESYRPSARRGSTPDTSTAHIGFRCARSVD